ncbi:hypothetical protein D9M70_437840 [compost metagenome]
MRRRHVATPRTRPASPLSLPLNSKPGLEPQRIGPCSPGIVARPCWLARQLLQFQSLPSHSPRVRQTRQSRKRKRPRRPRRAKPTCRRSLPRAHAPLTPMRRPARSVSSRPTRSTCNPVSRPTTCCAAFPARQPPTTRRTRASPSTSVASRVPAAST